ncbi:hypothetical protein EK21DRAFT_51922 [Setomelanomma holmii]|uniref:NAD(P)-binding domain-containing protein n=1 Tax=Setomelanomma holmii TaxID=210430 RepID=A0A9P4HJT2_9PLEO|nr:hypothetical protein EK21DRAFT_51922 [Setomelanomma holmii]
MIFKLIISGVSGRIGAEVLAQALRHPSVSSVIALSRRPLPDHACHDRLESVVLEDFTQYSDEIIVKLSGADACIWCGNNVSLEFPLVSADVARCMTTTAGDPILELQYPLAFARAFAPIIGRQSKRFRYLHLTGAIVERDQARSLWFIPSVRKTKVRHCCVILPCPSHSTFDGQENQGASRLTLIVQGQGETQMIDFAKDPSTSGLWETIVARPGMVVKRGTCIGEVSKMLAGSSGWYIRSDELALALIEAVMHGSEELLEPVALLKKGQELFSQRAAKQAG